MNRHFNNQQRAIVMTDVNLYKFDPEKKFKQSKAPIPIQDIASVVITEGRTFRKDPHIIISYQSFLYFWHGRAS